MARKGRSSRARRPTSINVFLTILTVFVLLLGGLGIYRDRADYYAKAPGRNLRNEVIANTLSRDLNSDLFYLATGALARTNGVNLAQTNIYFKASVKDLLEQRYDPRKFGDYRVTPLGSDLAISILPMSMVASSCTGDISVSGMIEPFSAPAYYRLSGYVLFDMKSAKEDITTFNITVDRLLPDMTPYVTTRLAEFDANGKSEFSDIGRMVRYMLTTLVRFRASWGIGSGPYDTEKDLLNEGDVELAVNLAVLLEEARLFGTYDERAVAAMDHFFYYATDPAVHQGETSWEPYDPTGIRPWGSAERKDFARYQNMMPQGVQRTMTSLLGNYVHEGLVDPADLLALYLNLDQSEHGWTIDPSDPVSILEKKFMFDGRYLPDTRDPSHIVYLSDVGPRELDLMDPSGSFTGDYKERFAVDQSPDFLTMGASISVTKDITVPYKFMTNVRLSEGSRTGGVPPPQPPPDHNWVMLWDFGIYGNFSIAVGRAQDGSQEDGTARQWLVNRTISLDIPINVYAFLKNKPMNSAEPFTNLNVGSPVGATFNFTKESMAYEHFSNATWSSVKDIYGAALEDSIRLVKASTCPFPVALAAGSNVTDLRATSALQNIPDNVWASVDEFVNNRLIGPDLSTEILRTFLNSEYFMKVDYIKGQGNGIKYTLRLTFETNVGNMAISCNAYEENVGIKGSVVVNSNVTIKGLLDVSYVLNGSTGPEYNNLAGSGTIQGHWSKKFLAQGWTLNKGIAVNLGGGLTIALMQDRGPSDPDMSDAMFSAVPKTLGPDPKTNLAMVTTKIKAVNVSGLALLFTTGDGWYGLRANDPASVKRMLDWAQGHSRVLVDLALAGRLDESTIGMGAARDLGGTSNIEAIALTDGTMFDAPLIYYLVSSQLFQLDRNIGPLRSYSLNTPDFSVPSLEPLAVRTYTMDASIYFEVLLTEPEVNYG
jgi:hypothetical protein